MALVIAGDVLPVCDKDAEAEPEDGFEAAANSDDNGIVMIVISAR